MLITFKTITQQTFRLEFESSCTINDIKKKICEEKGQNDFAVDSQKLIYNGKILLDTQTLDEVNIDEKKFVVVMVSRKKIDSSIPSSSTNAIKTDEILNKELTNSVKKDVSYLKTTSGTTDVHPQHEDMINAIQGMGYPRNEILRALKASFYDPNRAVEYLCNGIPDNFEPETVNDMRGGGIEEQSSQGLEFLQNSPQFQQLRDLVQSQPHLLQQIVQEIAGTNPELMNAIRNNQEEFLQMLNTEYIALSGNEHDIAVNSGADVAEAEAPNVVSINVSENDRNAIQRLKALGFSEQLVIEAYFACDKNEDLAANYILARMDEFQDDIGNAD